MSKIPMGRLLEQLPDRIAAEKRKKARNAESKHGSLGKSETTFTRLSLDSDKKGKLLKILGDTQGKVKKLLEKLDEWTLEAGKTNCSYSSSFGKKHSSYRVGVIRKIKNQISEGYTEVREILDSSSSISHPENLKLLGEINDFDETFSTTLTSNNVKDFQKRIFTLLKPVLKDLGVIN